VRQNLNRLGTVSGLGAILLWSTTFAFARSLSEQVGPLTAGAAAYLLGGACCVLRLAWGARPVRSLWTLSRAYLLGCGSLFTFYTTAIYLAVGFAKDRTQLLEIALVNYLWPAFTIILSLPLLRHRASLWLVPGTILALAGLFLVMTQGTHLSWASFREHVHGSPAAYALALAGAITWGLYSNLSRRCSEPGHGGAVEVFVPVTGLILLGLRLATNESTQWNLRAAGEAAGLGVVTALSYVLWDKAMRNGNLLLVATCSYFTPLLSTVMSCLYLRLSPNPRLWIGCLLLVSGSILTWRSVSERRVPGVSTSPD
jgi:drug/metabolite transporter (DMT)-like permease